VTWGGHSKGRETWTAEKTSSHVQSPVLMWRSRRSECRAVPPRRLGWNRYVTRLISVDVTVRVRTLRIDTRMAHDGIRRVYDDV
jgi:hypothetical protein